MTAQRQTYKRGVLLASFLKTDSDEEIMAEVQYVADNLELTNNYIFLLCAVDDASKKMITYNTTSSTQKLATARLYTIRVHRKKNTNTLYTINALNAAVAKDNGGKTGKQYRLDWAQYENSLLLTKNGVLEVCPVRVVKIFKIEDEPLNTPLADSSE